MEKITINYDLSEEILNYREEFNVFKVLRTNRYGLAGTLTYAACTDFILFKTINSCNIDINNLIIPKCIFDLMWSVSVYYYMDKLQGDVYKRRAEQNLSKLIPMLNDINVSTNFELLLDSFIDSRKTEITKDNNHHHLILENKYIMIPTHNPMFNNENETQLTSLHQEHIIGTKEYTLSIGLSQKNKQKILSPFLSTAHR